MVKRKRKSKHLLTAAILGPLLVAVVFSGACGKAAPAPAVTVTLTRTVTATPTPTPTPTPTAVKPIELKFATVPASATHHIIVNAQQPWIKEIEEKTGGRIKVTLFLGETLGKVKDNYDLGRDGIADVALHVAGYTPGRFPLITVAELPFLYTSAETGSKVLQAVYQQKPFKEFQDVKVLSLWTTSPHPIMTTKKKISTLEDMKGLKIRTAGGVVAKAVEATGAVSVTIPATDIYTSLERGVVDGFALAPASAPGYKLEELVKYVTLVPLGGSAAVYVRNKSAWDRLPKDLQDILGELGPKPGIMTGRSYDSDDQKALTLMTQRGAEVVTPSPAELKRWQALGQALWQSWAEDMEKKGLPGKEALDAFLAELQKAK